MVDNFGRKLSEAKMFFLENELEEVWLTDRLSRIFAP